MTIRLDATANTVVVTCTHCPGSWHALRLDRAGGWAAGAAHDAAVHPGNRQASDTLAKIRAKQRT